MNLVGLLRWLAGVGELDGFATLAGRNLAWRGIEEEISNFLSHLCNEMVIMKRI